MDYQEELASSIRSILNGRKPKLIPDITGTYSHAGVLIPLLIEEDTCKVLFTKRTDKVEHHKGQISFPGGKVDPEDKSLADTVLREAEEEIGLSREAVELLGRIDDTLTVVSNFIVHPLVGLVPADYNFTLNPFEVDSLLIVPLRLFFEKDGKWETSWSYTFEGVHYQSPAWRYKGEVIWGATARIMRNFVELFDGKLPLQPLKK